LDWLVTGLVQGTLEAAEAASVASVEDVRAHPKRLAAFTLPTHTTNRALKQFLHHAVYYSEAMVAERRRSASQIAKLFQFWVAHPEKLPEHRVELTANSPVHRVVCDYIAGMTDGYFERCYQQIIGA
jgi:dGTPase